MKMEIGNVHLLKVAVKKTTTAVELVILVIYLLIPVKLLKIAVKQTTNAVEFVTSVMTRIDVKLTPLVVLKTRNVEIVDVVRKISVKLEIIAVIPTKTAQLLVKSVVKIISV